MASFAPMNLPDIERGDDFPEITFTPDISLSGYAVEVQFKYVNVVLVKTLSIGSGVSIIGNSIKILPFKVEWSRGVYHYELKLTKDGVTETHFKGTIKVTD